MKKNTISFVFLLLFVITFIACQQNTPENESEKVDSSTNNEITEQEYTVNINDFEALYNSLTSEDVIKVRVTGEYTKEGIQKISELLQNDDKKIDLDIDISPLPLPNTLNDSVTFKDCLGLVCLKLADNSTETLPAAFCYGCKNLEKVILPEGLIKIDNSAFYNCSFKTIIIPNSVKELGTPNVLHKYGQSIFEGCENLEEITLPEGITVIPDHCFYLCKNLKTVFMSQKVSAFGKRSFSGCTKLTIPSLPSSLTEIETQTFNGCRGITEITIPSSVKLIEKNAFAISEWSYTCYLNKLSFENTNGWKIAKDGETTIELTAEQLSGTPEETVAFIKSNKYYEWTWTRSDS